MMCAYPYYRSMYFHSETSNRMLKQINSFPESGNVRIKNVAQFLSVSEATVWRRAKDPDFPKPIKLTPRITVFDAKEIRNWVDSKRNTR